MSNAIRSHPTGYGRSVVFRRRPHRRIFWKFILLAIAALLAMGWWFSRDNTGMARLIPSDHAAGLVLTDPLVRREQVAKSEVWSALPADWEPDKVQAYLDKEFGMPRWLLNNFIGEMCYITLNDLATYKDPVVYTRMSRIGCLIEWCGRLGPWTDADPAGGLNLRLLPGEQLYYARRGRVLAVSPSREALIGALTVLQEDSMDPERLQQLISDAGDEDLRGTIRLPKTHPLSEYVTTAGFALRVGTRDAALMARLEPNEVWKQRLEPLLAGIEPIALPEPPEGMAALSINFGRPIKALLMDTGRIAEWDWLTPSTWQAWESVPEDALPGAPFMLTQLLGQAGPELRLSIPRIDPHEILPVPVLMGIFEAGEVQPVAWYEQLGEEVAHDEAWESTPHLDEAQNTIYTPLIGGDSLEPAVRLQDGYLIASNSHPAVIGYPASGLPGKAAARKGNIYLRFDPAECIRAIAEMGRLFAESGLLNGYTQDSFQAATRAWIEQAAKFEYLTIAAGAHDNSIHADFRFSVTGSGAQATPIAGVAE